MEELVLDFSPEETRPGGHSGRKDQQWFLKILRQQIHPNTIYKSLLRYRKGAVEVFEFLRQVYK